MTKVRQAAGCRIEPLLLSQARAAGLNVSRLAASAVAEELDRLAKIAELDAGLGPLGDQEGATARSGPIRLSAADAIVAAYADTCPEPLVLTSDAADLTGLAVHAQPRIRVA